MAAALLTISHAVTNLLRCCLINDTERLGALQQPLEALPFSRGGSLGLCQLVFLALARISARRLADSRLID